MRTYAIPHRSMTSTSAKWIHYMLPIVLIVAGMAIAFPMSFFRPANVWMGVLLIPYAFIVEPKKRFNVVYLFLTLCFATLSIGYGVRMFYFFTIAFALLTAIELLIGKVNVIMIFLLGAMSPFFNQVTGLLGFPIRLYLSEWAGSLLYLGGWDVHVEGNLIVLDDASFSVDQACMGLNMLAISMLMAVFMVTFHFRRVTKKLSLISLSLVFVLTFLFNVGANFIRILMLVIFRIMPDNPMHDAVGIIVLVVYIFIPLYFISRWTVHRFGTPLHRLNNPFPQKLSTKQIWTLYCVSILILALGVFMNFKRTKAIMNYTDVTINTSKLEISENNTFSDLEAKQIDECVTKIYNDEILIYIKPIPEFFSGEHSPLFCWQGGGYEFKRIQKTVVSEQTIYLAQIVNRAETLYTAWWYSNGEVITVDQFDWRIRMMQGEPAFNLINVTCPSEQKLIHNLTDIFKHEIISINHKSL